MGIHPFPPPFNHHASALAYWYSNSCFSVPDAAGCVSYSPHGPSIIPDIAARPPTPDAAHEYINAIHVGQYISAISASVDLTPMPWTPSIPYQMYGCGETHSPHESDIHFKDPSPASPLSLVSSKATLGHSEPAAGMIGLIHAMHGLSQHAEQPLLHLRSVNPFVACTLDGWAGSGAHLPRQAGPKSMPDTMAAAAAVACSGVSSFAFQV